MKEGVDMAPIRLLEELPGKGKIGTFVGRIWSDEYRGPRVVLVKDGAINDITEQYPTVSHALEDVDELISNAFSENDAGCPSDRGWEASRVLAPVDLQVVLAAGLTYVGSEFIRAEVHDDEFLKRALTRLEVDLDDVIPGTPAAGDLRSVLAAADLWTDKLEVAYGQFPETFTKAVPLSSIGTGEEVAAPEFSKVYAAEPELVLICDSIGNPRGASLGNDFHLSDIGALSTLLIRSAKDNCGSSIIGPAVRLFDGEFCLATVLNSSITIVVRGVDGYQEETSFTLNSIKRPISQILDAMIGNHHQYPDGFAAFLGTGYSTPTARHEGGGYTLRVGDVIEIHNRYLGTLRNVVVRPSDLESWNFGLVEMLEYLKRISSTQ